MTRWEIQHRYQQADRGFVSAISDPEDGKESGKDCKLPGLTSLRDGMLRIDEIGDASGRSRRDALCV